MQVAKMMKSGMHAVQAKAIAGSVNAAVSAAGTSVTNATLLTAEINNLTTVGASTGVKLPLVFDPGDKVVVYNSSGTTALVYPNTGATLNAAASSLSLPTAKSVMFFADSATHWMTVPVVPS